MKKAAYPTNVNNSSSAARISNAAHSIMEIGANQLKESALSTLAASCPSAVANHRACVATCMIWSIAILHTIALVCLLILL